jgi:thiol:disulfide interchange protein
MSDQKDRPELSDAMAEQTTDETSHADEAVDPREVHPIHSGPVAMSPGSRLDGPVPTNTMFVAFIALAIGVGILAIVANRHQSVRAPKAVPAHTVLSDAIAQATKENKLIYAEFTASWCSACKVFEEKTLGTPEGQAALKQVVYVRIDFDRNQEIAKQYGVTGLPAGLILEAVGDKTKLIERHTGTVGAAMFKRFIERNVSRKASGKK